MKPILENKIIAKSTEKIDTINDKMMKNKRMNGQYEQFRIWTNESKT